MTNSVAGGKSEKKVKDWKKTKPYKKKLRRHEDAVLSIYSPEGSEGSHIISGSADQMVRGKFIVYHSQGCK